jgi:hypothetical protein
VTNAADELIRDLYDHLFNKGAAYIWPGVLNEIRVWCEDNNIEDPK